MNIDDVKSKQQGTKRVFLALKLETLSAEDILQRYDHPRLLQSHAHSLGVPCSFAIAEDILLAAGWVRGPNFFSDKSVPPQARRRGDFGPDDIVPLSRYFMVAHPGSVIRYTSRELNDEGFPIKYTATVLPNGKLRSVEWPEAPLTPTSWARKCQGRLGRMAIMPKSFWRRVKLVVNGIETDSDSADVFEGAPTVDLDLALDPPDAIPFKKLKSDFLE